MHSGSENSTQKQIVCIAFLWIQEFIFVLVSYWCNLLGACMFIKCMLHIYLAIDFCRFCAIIRVFSSPSQQPMTSDFEGFLYQILSITLCSYLNSWERASIFPFECSVLNKGTTGTNFYNVFGMTHSKPALYH